MKTKNESVNNSNKQNMPNAPQSNKNTSNMPKLNIFKFNISDLGYGELGKFLKIENF